MFCMLGGIFAFRWLSYSVAGRGVVNTMEHLAAISEPLQPPTATAAAAAAAAAASEAEITAMEQEKLPTKAARIRAAALQGRKKETPPPWKPSIFSFSGSEASLEDRNLLKLSLP